MSKMQNSLPQRHSKMSNMKTETENSLPQRHSRMSNLVLESIVPAKRSEQTILTINVKNKWRCFMDRWDYGRMGQHKSSPAQLDSGISKLAVGVLGIPGSLGRKTKNETTHVQRDSGMSILKTRPYRLLAVRLVPLCGDPYRPLVFKDASAQRYSGNSNLDLFQKVEVGDGDTAEDCTGDAEETLIGTRQVQVVQIGPAGLELYRRTVDGSVDPPGVAPDGFRRERVNKG